MNNSESGIEQVLFFEKPGFKLFLPNLTRRSQLKLPPSARFSLEVVGEAVPSFLDARPTASCGFVRLGG
jgi:hypothetical protein